MTPQELVNKIEYEYAGGIYEAVTVYGLLQHDLTHATKEQREAWKRVVQAAKTLSKLCDQMYAVFPDIYEEEEHRWPNNIKTNSL